jgi:hypothetical protein
MHPQADTITTRDLSRFCITCKKEFSSKQTLREHLYVHSGERPYKCTIPGCNESFRQGSLLSIHKRIHREIEKGVSKIKKPNQALAFPKLTSLICTEPEKKLKSYEEKGKSFAKDLDLSFIKEFL